jgi:hypothetical protein
MYHVVFIYKMGGSNIGERRITRYSLWSVFTCPVSCADTDPARAVRGALVRGARRAAVSVGVCVCVSAT